MVELLEIRVSRWISARTALFFCLLGIGAYTGDWSFTISYLHAQTVATPVLHHRFESQRLEETDTVVISRGRTMLPLEASGQYSLGESGESIEIDLERNRLGGFISRLGDRMSDQGTPLTFFFATSFLNGQELSFTTHRVHGVWFSFEGTIVRGRAPSRGEEGYYLLEGRLVMHDASSQTQQMREVSLPRAREFSSQ